MHPASISTTNTQVLATVEQYTNKTQVLSARVEQYTNTWSKLSHQRPAFSHSNKTQLVLARCLMCPTLPAGL